jgi:hypothetical protein
MNANNEMTFVLKKQFCLGCSVSQFLLELTQFCAQESDGILLFVDEIDVLGRKAIFGDDLALRSIGDA